MENAKQTEIAPTTHRMPNAGGAYAEQPDFVASSVARRPDSGLADAASDPVVVGGGLQHSSQHVRGEKRLRTAWGHFLLKGIFIVRPAWGN